MTCRICQKPQPGQRQTCPEVCRSRHQANLKLERQIAKWYRAGQKARRGRL